MRAYREANKGRVDRREYMHEYYEANKDRLKKARKPTVRTRAQKDAEARYREKRRILKEIEEMKFGLNE